MTTATKTRAPFAAVARRVLGIMTAIEKRELSQMVGFIALEETLAGAGWTEEEFEAAMYGAADSAIQAQNA